MRVIILGCGTSTGVPIVGCRCPVCSSEDPRDRRTRASVLIETGGRNILVDTSPDLRFQALRQGVSRIDAVLFTHTHADHVNGIDDLRGFHFINRILVPGYGSRETMAALTRMYGYIFTGVEAEGYAQLVEPHVVSAPFDLFGITVTPIPLLHGTVAATGYRFGDVAYLTDCSQIPPASMALLQGLDLLIVDGLRYTPHPTHFNIDGAVAVARELRPRRTVLTHLTHEVSCRENGRLPEGVEFAYDGMILDAAGQL